MRRQWVVCATFCALTDGERALVQKRAPYQMGDWHPQRCPSGACTPDSLACIDATQPVNVTPTGAGTSDAMRRWANLSRWACRGPLCTPSTTCVGWTR